MRPPQPSTSGSEIVLSAFQRRIVLAVARGHTTDQIAAREHVSPATIKTHLRYLMLRTGTRNRAHLTAWAYESGLLRPHSPHPQRPALEPSPDRAAS